MVDENSQSNNSVAGIKRLEDLIGIIQEDPRCSAELDTFLDEMQGIFNKLPTDQDSQYILSCLFNGTKLDQALAQMEVYKDESSFMATLKFALEDESIKNKIRSLVS